MIPQNPRLSSNNFSGLLNQKLWFPQPNDTSSIVPDLVPIIFLVFKFWKKVRQKSKEKVRKEKIKGKKQILKIVIRREGERDKGKKSEKTLKPQTTQDPSPFAFLFFAKTWPNPTQLWPKAPNLSSRDANLGSNSSPASVHTPRSTSPFAMLSGCH